MSQGLIASIAAWVSKIKTDTAAILVDTAAMQPTIATNLDAAISSITGGADYTMVAVAETAGSGNYTVPTGIKGPAWLCMAGGGGSGAHENHAGGAEGGEGGEMIFMQPIWLDSYGATIPWVCGEGGTHPTTFSNGDAGGTSSFGGFECLGGAGGLVATTQNGANGADTLFGTTQFARKTAVTQAGAGNTGSNDGGDGGNTPVSRGGVGDTGYPSAGGGGASLGNGGNSADAGGDAPVHGGGGAGADDAAGDGQDGADGAIFFIYVD
jgi:hypothetical protein